MKMKSTIYHRAGVYIKELRTSPNQLIGLKAELIPRGITCRDKQWNTYALRHGQNDTLLKVSLKW